MGCGRQAVGVPAWGACADKERVMARNQKVTYSPESAGLRALGGSSAMSQKMVQAARDLAGTAESVGRSKYGSAPYTVRSGRNNEARSGAIAYESERDWRDARDEILKRTARAMGSRVPSGLVEYTRKDGTVRMATPAQYNAWMKARGLS